MKPYPVGVLLARSAHCGRQDQLGLTVFGLLFV